MLAKRVQQGDEDAMNRLYEANLRFVISVAKQYQDYNSIVEDPESYGYDSIDGHQDEMIQDIKSDVNSVFKCNIDVSVIINVIEKYENKRNNRPVVL